MLLLAAVAAGAADEPERTTVFINSAPLKATLTLDGVRHPQRTPVLIRGLPPGAHRYGLSKDGHASVTGTVELVSGEVTEIEVSLEAEEGQGSGEEEVRGKVNQGDALLAEGRLLDALTTYAAVVDANPDSPLVPGVLYKIAKIHSMTENMAQAVSTLKLLVSQYPVVELYDRAQKNLADLHYELGFFRESVDHLDRISFSDELFTRDSISRYRNEILGVWFVQLDLWESIDRVVELRRERDEMRTQLDRAARVSRATGVGAGITFSLGAGAATAAVISFVLGDIAYRRYLSAEYSEDAAVLRDDVELFRVLTIASGSAAAAGLAGGLAFVLARPKEGPYRERLEEIDAELDELLRRRQ